MEKISCSEDEVSKVLSSIFAKAIPHSPEELQRARDRRELGNPPGKSTNPIGDQLTWEQILTHFKGKKRLWIISRDSDYGTVYGGKGFLNCFLYDELCRVASEPKVYLFHEIVEGIRHFVDTTGVKAEKCLTSEEVEEIDDQEKSLPDLTILNTEFILELAELRKQQLAESKKLSDSLRQLLGQQLAESRKPNEALIRIFRQQITESRKLNDEEKTE